MSWGISKLMFTVRPRSKEREDRHCSLARSGTGSSRGTEGCRGWQRGGVAGGRGTGRRPVAVPDRGPPEAGLRLGQMAGQMEGRWGHPHSEADGATHILAHGRLNRRIQPLIGRDGRRATHWLISQTVGGPVLSPLYREQTRCAGRLLTRLGCHTNTVNKANTVIEIMALARSTVQPYTQWIELCCSGWPLGAHRELRIEAARRDTRMSAPARVAVEECLARIRKRGAGSEHGDKATQRRGV